MSYSRRSGRLLPSMRCNWIVRSYRPCWNDEVLIRNFLLPLLTGIRSFRLLVTGSGISTGFGQHTTREPEHWKITGEPGWQHGCLSPPFLIWRRPELKNTCWKCCNITRERFPFIGRLGSGWCGSFIILGRRTDRSGTRYTLIFLTRYRLFGSKITFRSLISGISSRLGRIVWRR